MALHDENSFKVKMYESAAELIRNLSLSLYEIDKDDLENYDGIGKKIAAVITEILETGKFTQLDELLSKTPSGLLEFLNIKVTKLGARYANKFVACKQNENTKMAVNNYEEYDHT